MSKVDRNNPIRSTASESRYTLFEFDREFPDDAACLEWLVRYRWPEGIFCPSPKCQRVTKHHRERKRPSYSCQFCGHRVHPMVGTIFEDSATSLRLWFYAIYLMASTRCGISAKQLERELGVTYKTAWRMFKQIRSLLGQNADGQFSGTVEIDDAYIGGRDYWRKQGKPRAGVGRGGPGKTPVVGMAERGRNGRKGRVSARVVPNLSRKTVHPMVKEKVLPATMIYTDEHKAYDELWYPRGRINHGQRVYVSGDVHTNTIEGFWSLLKRGISGVYHGVSTKYLQTYLDEYVFRYNSRDAAGRGMFNAFLARIPEASSPEASL